MRFPTVALLVLVLTLNACRDPDSPEQQIRNVIGQVETAAEARDVGDLMEHVSEQYQDGSGQGREDAGRYVRGYFIANQSIHLLTRVERVEFPATEEARAVVTVGMVGREADASSSWNLAANVYEFDVTLRREGDAWKVTYAKWQQK